jgi:hypothetical protein
MGWDNPSPLAGAHGHHSAGGINELVTIVKMQWNHVPGGVVVSKSRDRGLAITRPIENRSLALLRHPLAQYRKYAAFRNR